MADSAVPANGRASGSTDDRSSHILVTPRSWRRGAVEQLRDFSFDSRTSNADDIAAALDVLDVTTVEPTNWQSMRTITPPGDDLSPAQRRRQVREWDDPGLEQPFAPRSRREISAFSVCHRWTAWWQASQAWLLVISIGLCTALSGCLIELGVRKLSSLRFGFCRASWFATEGHCPEDSWIQWNHDVFGFLAFLLLGLAFAAASAVLVFRFAPAAAGSGIPEVKTILNGFVLSDAVSGRTLCVKGPGLCLSVAAGMALGKEGPLVHVACCWAQVLSGIFPQFRTEAARREIFSAAAAAGVSTAFGAPLGGVLFSLEEVSSFFPSRTLLLCFVSAVTAATVLQIADLTGTGSLTMFSVEYNSSVHPLELVVFVGLGVIGGLVGAAFNSINVRWSRFRALPAFKNRVHPVLEVSVIAFITLVTSWPLALLQPLSSESIHAMFGNCGDSGPYSYLKSRLGLCTDEGQYAEATSALVTQLLAACAIRWFQMTLTFGTKCPAGLFVPSLYVGAALGRCVGILTRSWAMDTIILKSIEPGVYSMVGAAAVLGGVCRVTISLVVIMLELTGGLVYVVPFMLSVLAAKIVGDSINEGIYDLYIVLKGYPFLHEELNVMYSERCCDIMEIGLTKIDLHLDPRPVDLRDMLEVFGFRGFPVVQGPRFLGYIRRQKLTAMLGKLEEERGESTFITLGDVVAFTDRNIMRMVPDAPLEQAHNVFKQLGCQHIFLVGAQDGIGSHEEALQGILTKKNFIQFLKSGRVGHMPRVPGNGDASSSPARSHSPEDVAAAAVTASFQKEAGQLRFSVSRARRSSTLRRISLNHPGAADVSLGMPVTSTPDDGSQRDPPLRNQA